MYIHIYIYLCLYIYTYMHTYQGGHSPLIRCFCGDEQCVQLCSFPGCRRRCAGNHWHVLGGGDAWHDCGHSDHTCERLRGGRCVACGDPCEQSAAVPHARHECAKAAERRCVLPCSEMDVCMCVHRCVCNLSTCTSVHLHAHTCTCTCTHSCSYA